MLGMHSHGMKTMGGLGRSVDTVILVLNFGEFCANGLNNVKTKNTIFRNCFLKSSRLVLVCIEGDIL